MALFPILLKVEESQVGTVLLALRKLPIADIGLMLDDLPAKRGRIPGANGSINGTAERVEKPTKRNNPHGDGPRAQDIIITELMSGQKTGDHIRKAIEAHGYEGGGAYALLSTLVEKGIAIKIAKGIYDLSPAARAKLADAAPPGLPAPNVKDVKNVRKAKRQRAAMGHRFPSTESFAIVAGIVRSHGGAAARPIIVKACEAKGMTERTTDGVINRMKEAKYLKSPEKGFYELTAKGSKHFAQEAPTEVTEQAQEV